MAKYRKKPIVIEAEQWNPNSINSFPRPTIGKPDRLGVVWEYGPRGLLVNGRITTLEGDFIVTFDDWIITGVKGEKYPCKPDIFEATYEKVQ